jgi:hypothetical protein
MEVKTAVMDAMGFLYVSLCSSTDQLHESLGSRRACVRSEAGFSSHDDNHARGLCRRKAAFSCTFFFWWAKGLHPKDIHIEMLPIYSAKCVSCKAVHNWVMKVSQGRSVTDDAQPGSALETATGATV